VKDNQSGIYHYVDALTTTHQEKDSISGADGKRLARRHLCDERTESGLGSYYTN
jgi:hypothetical protein